MEFIPIVSTNIDSVFYDEEKEMLHVIFKKGMLHYAYEDVPKSVYEDFMNAESKGQYFARNIKKEYVYRKEP